MCASPVDGVPLGPFRRSVCSCLHLTFPSVSSRLIVLRVTHHVHVSILSDRVLPYPAGYVFPLPFGRWRSLLGRSCPTRGSAFLTVGSPTDRPPPDSIGVSTFRTDEMRPGRVPSILRGRGACINATAGVDHLAGPLTRRRLTQHRRLHQPSCPATQNDEASSTVHFRSPFRSSPRLSHPDG